MIRSSTKELLKPFKEPEREFRSSRKLFKTLSLDESRSLEYNLFSDVEENSKEEVAKTMAETMKQYMSKTRADYGSGIARPKIDDKDHFELKGQLLKELRENTFSGSDHEDANKHIDKVLEIVNLFHVPNIIQDQIMLRVFPMLALDDDGDDVIGKLSLDSSEIKIRCKVVLDCLAKEELSNDVDYLRSSEEGNVWIKAYVWKYLLILDKKLRCKEPLGWLSSRPTSSPAARLAIQPPG
ncbi:hypothetical protein Tco_0396991 [Tanacetum coccineum]